MGVLDLSWHPCACVAAVVTAQGSIYIWARHHRERWDAFAPGFDELDNNVVRRTHPSCCHLKKCEKFLLAWRRAKA